MTDCAFRGRGLNRSAVGKTQVSFTSLSFTGRRGTTLGDQWVPPERLRRVLFDHSRDQGSSPAGLATTS